MIDQSGLGQQLFRICFQDWEVLSGMNAKPAPRHTVLMDRRMTAIGAGAISMALLVSAGGFSAHAADGAGSEVEFAGEFTSFGGYAADPPWQWQALLGQPYEPSMQYVKKDSDVVFSLDAYGLRTNPNGRSCRVSISVNGREEYSAPHVPQIRIQSAPPFGIREGGPLEFSVPGSAFASLTASPSRQGRIDWTYACDGLGYVRASAPITMLPAPPPGRDVGVSINDGDDFTNSAEVDLWLGWGIKSRLNAYTIDRVKVSNDGGFAPSKSRVVDLRETDPLPWQLVELGPERLPRSVYVRFHDVTQGWLPQTYSDDIVLDTTRPEIQSAALSQSSTPTLTVRAKDNRSGVTRMKIARGKSKKNAKERKYRKRVPLKGKKNAHVRVQDGAGNWSKWRKAKVR